MTHSPPIDQRIVDEYFQLASRKKTKAVAWLYGMIATYGVKPDELNGFTWQSDNSILLQSKKKKIAPLHPQWVFLFGLKEKRSCEMQDRLESLSRSLYQAIAYQDVRLNITDLLLAHRMRKNHSRAFKNMQPACLAFAGAS
jgi:hypothetical protein